LRKYIEKYNLSTEKIDQNRRNNSWGKKLYKKETFIEELNNGEVTLKNAEILKKLVAFGFKKYECEICGISSWMRNSLTLELHHKDGNNKNNEYKNLQIVCPNCHSQTDNFRYKNNMNINVESIIKECILCGKKITKTKTGMCFECYTKQRRKKSPINSHKKIFCPVCKTNKMNKESKKCQKCYFAEKSKRNEISKAELKNKIRNASFKKVASDYSVNVTTIRDWCRKYSIPTKKEIIDNFTDEEWESI